MRIAKLIFLLVLAGAASALSSPVYTRRRILQDDSTIVDPYEKPLNCIGSSKWVYNGTIVGVVEGGEGKKKMTWEKCCELCYKNPFCYFWQRGSNKEGQRCVMFSQTAARYEAKMVPCTCSRVSGKSPIVGGR